MRLYPIFVLLLLLNFQLHAQSNNGDIIPGFAKGGHPAFGRFLESNINPLVPATNGAPPGRYVVTISFMVDTLGKISDVRLEQDPGYGTGEDVLKAFRHPPKWTPAKLNGKPVMYRQKQNVAYSVSR